jgi:hypothetical protein
MISSASYYLNKESRPKIRVCQSEETASLIIVLQYETNISLKEEQAWRRASIMHV